MISPDFWTDESIVELSPWARLLFIGLWQLADDEGRLIYKPKSIKLKLFPADDVDVEKCCAELRQFALICAYDSEGVDYIEITNFGKHQKLDKRRPSKHPAPNCADPRPRTELELNLTELEQEENCVYTRLFEIGFEKYGNDFSHRIKDWVELIGEDATERAMEQTKKGDSPNYTQKIVDRWATDGIPKKVETAIKAKKGKEYVVLVCENGHEKEVTEDSRARNRTCTTCQSPFFVKGGPNDPSVHP